MLWSSATYWSHCVNADLFIYKIFENTVKTRASVLHVGSNDLRRKLFLKKHNKVTNVDLNHDHSAPECAEEIRKFANLPAGLQR